jgi:hypothetical protein
MRRESARGTAYLFDKTIANKRKIKYNKINVACQVFNIVFQLANFAFARANSVEVKTDCSLF